MKRKNKIRLIIPSVLVLLIVAVYLWLFHFGLVERIVNWQLQKYLEKNLTAKIYVGDLAGNILDMIILNDITILYDDGDERYVLAYIPSVKAKYSWRHIWDGQYFFESIVVDSADFNLRQTDGKAWLIPKGKREKSSDLSVSTTEFQVGELSLNNLSINLLRSDDTLIFKDIYFDARVDGFGNTFSAIIDRLSYRSSDNRLNLLSAGGVITATGSNFMFQNFQLRTDSSDLEIEGQILVGDSLQTYIGLNARKLNLRELSSLINKKLSGEISAIGILEYNTGQLSGDVTLSGTFQRRMFDSLRVNFKYADRLIEFDTLDGRILNGCLVNARGDIDFSAKPPEYHLIGKIKHFDLNNLLYNTHRSDLSGDINLTGRSFKGEELILDIITTLDESWFDEYHTFLAAGEMVITSDSIKLMDEFALKYHDNLFILNGLLDYHGPVDISGRTNFNNLSAFNDKLFIKKMGGRAELKFRVSGDLANPNIGGILSSDSLWIYDVFSNDASFRFSLEHFLKGRQGAVNVFLNDGIMYGLPYDSLSMNLNVDSQYVQLEDVSFENEYTNAEFLGLLDYLSYPQKLTINSADIDLMSLQFKNDSSIIIYIDSTGYDVVNFRLLRPSGFIEGSGRIQNNDSLDFRVLGRNIHMSPLLNLYTDEYDLYGIASGQVDLAGTLKNPVIRIKGQIDSLRFKSLVLGDLDADIEYQNSMVEIKSAAVKGTYGNYVARGTFPINLSLTEVANRFPDEEQNIRISAQDTRLDLVSMMFHDVEDLTGDFNADFALTGTFENPEINGLATLKNGRMKVYDLVDPLEKMTVNINMSGNTVSIDTVFAECRNGGKKGRLSAKGTVIINSLDQMNYNISLAARDFSARYELGDISGVVDADLTVRGLTPPKVEGEVRPISVQYLENFAAGDEGWLLLSTLQDKDSWDLNLDVQTVSNLWVKNDDIDAELSSDILFVRENGRFRYYGTMEILRGKAYFADRTFRLEPGGIINYDDIEYPNPKLGIEASTKIRSATQNISGEIETSSLLLKAHIGGTLDEPIITAAEGSEFSTEEIAMVLLLDQTLSDSTGTETQSMILSRATNYLSSQVGRFGSRKLGVETFEIDPVYGDKFDPLGTTFTLGFYTLPNLYVYGRSALSLQERREAGFEYRFQKFLLMEGQVDEDNLYSLNLKFFRDY